MRRPLVRRRVNLGIPSRESQVESMEPEQGAEPFEQLLETAEKAVSALERGELSLEDSLNSYEQGVRALARCYSLLQDAEKRVEVLSGNEDFGWKAESSKSGGDSVDSSDGSAPEGGLPSGAPGSEEGPAWRSASADPSLKEALERIDREKFSSSSED
jgi:exodeoxyribonuclease VII small subunit